MNTPYTPETFEDLEDGSGNRPLLTPEEEAARLVAQRADRRPRSGPTKEKGDAGQ